MDDAMLDHQLPDPEHSEVDYVFRNAFMADEWVECPRCGGVANVATWASGRVTGICEENGDCEWSWEEEADYS